MAEGSEVNRPIAARLTTRDRIWLGCFVGAAIVHLLFLAPDLQPWSSITKCLLAPILMAWVISRGGPPLLAVALLGCFFGDLFLELDERWFIPGMAAFAVAHMCWITLFTQLGAGRSRPIRWPVLFGYLGFGIVLIVWAWPGLPSELQIPVVIYSALLMVTAVLATSINPIAGAGGLLFLISDAVIALGLAGRLPEDSTLTRLAIMSMYAAAIALLSVGIMLATRLEVK